MARNCEKHFVGLNRVFLEEQWKRDEERKRPPLYQLKTADEVRKWMPSIQKDIEYYLRQLGGARKHDYTETKLKEFEEKVEQLEREHKRFVNKVFELDPSQRAKGVPWQPKGYSSKRKLKDASSACSSSQLQCQNMVASPSTKKKRKPIVLNVLKNEEEKSVNHQ